MRDVVWPVLVNINDKTSDEIERLSDPNLKALSRR